MNQVTHDPAIVASMKTPWIKDILNDSDANVIGGMQNIGSNGMIIIPPKAETMLINSGDIRAASNLMKRHIGSVTTIGGKKKFEAMDGGVYSLEDRDNNLYVGGNNLLKPVYTDPTRGYSIFQSQEGMPKNVSGGKDVSTFQEILKRVQKAQLEKKKVKTVKRTEVDPKSQKDKKEKKPVKKSKSTKSKKQSLKGGAGAIDDLVIYPNTAVSNWPLPISRTDIFNQYYNYAAGVNPTLDPSPYLVGSLVNYMRQHHPSDSKRLYKFLNPNVHSAALGYTLLQPYVDSVPITPWISNEILNGWYGDSSFLNFSDYFNYRAAGWLQGGNEENDEISGGEDFDAHVKKAMSGGELQAIDAFAEYHKLYMMSNKSTGENVNVYSIHYDPKTSSFAHTMNAVAIGIAKFFFKMSGDNGDNVTDPNNINRYTSSNAKYHALLKAIAEHGLGVLTNSSQKSDVTARIREAILRAIVADKAPVYSNNFSSSQIAYENAVPLSMRNVL